MSTRRINKGISYINRDGRPMSAEDHKVMAADTSYTTVRQFENGCVHVLLRWSGVIKDASQFRMTWPVFVMHVRNMDAEGKWRSDPVDDGKTFAYEEDAIKAYEGFVFEWTDSVRKEDGSLVEVGNNLTPPPPPDPDVPESVGEGLLTEEGAW